MSEYLLFLVLLSKNRQDACAQPFQPAPQKDRTSKPNIKEGIKLPKISDKDSVGPEKTTVN